MTTKYSPVPKPTNYRAKNPKAQRSRLNLGHTRKMTGPPPTADLVVELLEGTRTGVGGYLSGQHKMVEQLGQMLPQLGERMMNFLMANVEEHIDGKGKLQRMVELEKDLSPGQIVLLKALMSRIVPGAVPMDLQGKQNQATGPKTVNISVHTVGGRLDPSKLPGVVDGAAKEVSKITFHPPVDNASNLAPVNPAPSNPEPVNPAPVTQKPQ